MFLTITGFFINLKITMLIILVLTLLSGAFYCGWICPYGFVQDIFNKIGSQLGIKKKKMPIRIHKILVFSRYIILVLLLLITSNLIFNIMSLDPRANFASLLLGNTISLVSIILICFFALISLFFQRPFCNYLCFEGAKYGLISSLRLFTIKRNISACVNCKKCDQSCPMNIQVSKCKNLKSLQCINCFQCITNCSIEGALKYGKATIKTHEKIKYALSFVILLGLITNFIINNTNIFKNHLNNSSKYEVAKFFKKIENTNQNSKNTFSLPDGVYTGKGKGYRSIITVNVKLENGKITKVKVIDHNDDKKWFDRANEIIPDKIIKTQTIDIDIVSGATYSSSGIIDAVKDALNKPTK